MVQQVQFAYGLGDAIIIVVVVLRIMRWQVTYKAILSSAGILVSGPNKVTVPTQMLGQKESSAVHQAILPTKKPTMANSIGGHKSMLGAHRMMPYLI